MNELTDIYWDYTVNGLLWMLINYNPVRDNQCTLINVLEFFESICTSIFATYPSLILLLKLYIIHFL